jgi:neuron navigator 2
VTIFVGVNSIDSSSHGASHQHQPQHRQKLLSELPIGCITVNTCTTWTQLDALIRRTFQDYLIKIDPATSIGLSGESVHSYRVGEVCRKKDCDQPELLPIGYLVGDVTCITVGLKASAENALDQLSFELLIPKLILQRYVNLLLEHRRVILSGSSGTGKTFLAQRLAEFLVHRSGNNCPSDSIAIFQVDNQSGRELRQYLTNIASQCTAEVGGATAGTTARLPSVIILDNLHRVTSLSDVFNGFLSVPDEFCPYVIGTMNQTSACSAADLQMHHNFRWVLYANHIEPVRSFLGRYLRRQLTSAELTSVHSTVDKMTAVVDWLPKVWQCINRFLESHSSADLTIGPRLFLSCPMDFNQAEIWFTDLWNYSIVPYLLEAVRDSLQSYSGMSRGPWDELADWVTSSYPWSLPASSTPHLLRLRPQLDVVYESPSHVTYDTDQSQQTTGGTGELGTQSINDRLSSMLARLQEAALHHSDHDSDSSDVGYHDNIS